MSDKARMPPPDWTDHADSPMALTRKLTESVSHDSSACEASGAENSGTYMTSTAPKDFELLQSLPGKIHQLMAENGKIDDLYSAEALWVQYRGESFQGTLTEGNASLNFTIVARLFIHAPGSNFTSRSWGNGQWGVATTREPNSEEIKAWNSLLNEDKRTVTLKHQGKSGYISNPVSLGEMSLSHVDETVIESGTLDVSICDFNS